jgi:hypothetical protein
VILLTKSKLNRYGGADGTALRIALRVPIIARLTVQRVSRTLFAELGAETSSK